MIKYYTRACNFYYGKTSKEKVKKNVVLENFNTQDKDTRLLTYKVLLEKFNDKYSGLKENQKTLLKEYVNSVTNSPSLKSYLNQEIKEVKKDLSKYSKKVEDKVEPISQPVDTIRIESEHMIYHEWNSHVDSVLQDRLDAVMDSVNMDCGE